MSDSADLVTHFSVHDFRNSLPDFQRVGLCGSLSEQVADNTNEQLNFQPCNIGRSDWFVYTTASRDLQQARISTSDRHHRRLLLQVHNREWNPVDKFHSIGFSPHRYCCRTLYLYHGSKPKRADYVFAYQGRYRVLLDFCVRGEFTNADRVCL